MPRYPSRTPLQSSLAAGGVTAVDRALTILAAFREGDQALALAELVRRTQLVRSTALRLLASLQHFRLVQKREDGLYQLDREIARLFGIYVASFSLDGLVVPALRVLVKKTGESAAFHVRQGDRRVCLYRVDSSQALRDNTRIGDILPLERGSGGRVLLAFGGARGAAYEKIRRDGYAAMIGDRTPELAGISAPVFRSGGELAGVVSLTMPTSRYRPANVKPVLQAAADISLRLGALPERRP